MINNQALRQANYQVWLGTFVIQLCSTIVLLSIILIAFWRLASYPDPGMDWSGSTGRVVSIQEEGPASSLLQIGDTITSINGQSISKINLAAKFQLTSTTELQIERDGRPMTIDLQAIAPAPLIVLERTTALLAALTFWLLSLVFLLFKTRDARSLLFFIFCQISITILVTGQLSSFEPYWVSQLYKISIWWFVPIVVHLHMYFPTTLPWSQKWFLIALYGVATSGSLLTVWFDSTIQPVSILNLYDARNLWFVGGLVIVVGLLVRTYLLNRTPDMRRQIGLVVLGGIVAFVPLFSFYLIPILIFDRLLLPYQTAFLFLIILPLTYGYAILGYQLIHLDRYVSRSAVSVLVATLLGGLYLMMHIALEGVVTTQHLSHPLINLVIVLVFSLIAPILYRRLLIFVNHLLYGGWYDYRSVVQRMTNMLDQRPEDATSLAQMLVHGIQTTMHIDHVRLLLADQHGHLVIEGSSLTCDIQSTTSRKAIPITSVVYHYFQTNPHPVSTFELEDMLTSDKLSLDEQKMIANDEFKLWVPMYASQQLIGLWMLGPKRGSEGFDVNDLDILNVVVQQTSVVIQNKLLINELHKRADEQQQLHQQVLKAREEERKRLARELHDEIIQALVGLNYYLSTLRGHGDIKVQSQGLQLQSDVKVILNDVRRICTELRPPAIDNLGLVAAVRSQLRTMACHSDVQIVSHLQEDTKQTLSEDAAICIYRVLQEALSNIQKHAHANYIEIWLTIRDDMVELIVEDNGHGFDVPSNLNHLLQHAHFGLLGVQERLHLLHGTLQVQSQPNHGTRLHAHIPRSLELTNNLE
ncbi:MAG: ATP-binding protein [Chloroflexota bacterium]